LTVLYQSIKQSDNNYAYGFNNTAIR